MLATMSDLGALEQMAQAEYERYVGWAAAQMERPDQREGLANEPQSGNEEWKKRFLVAVIALDLILLVIVWTGPSFL
jgi:Flp pilus assembly protein TadB